MNKISKTIEFFERLTPGNSSKSGMGKTNSKNAHQIGVYRANQGFEPRAGSNCLFLIDPQNDFIIDGGSLQVDGAIEDSKRTASFIMKNLDNIGDIYCSLDTHMQFHIAHKAFWQKKVLDVNENEDYDWSKATVVPIESFEQIPHKAVVGHVKSKDNNTVYRYFTQKKEFQEWGEHYTKQLEKGSEDDGVPGTLTLTIWPDHCLIGSTGHNVQADMYNALQAWETRSQRSVTYILKGKNSKTEHYSALKAEVVVPNDPATKFNKKLYQSLDKHSKIYVAGQARSHCVNMTTRHLVQQLRKDKKRTDKVVLLKGGMSDVYMCEAIGKVFVTDMEKAGVQTLDITDIKPLEGDWSKQLVEEIQQSIDDKFNISPEKTPKKVATATAAKPKDV